MGAWEEELVGRIGREVGEDLVLRSGNVADFVEDAKFPVKSRVCKTAADFDAGEDRVVH
jgi:hypothetical protein